MNIDIVHELTAHRRDGESEWLLPPWGSNLGFGIYPLVVHLQDRIIPVGTAFLISHLGVLATGLHNVREAFRFHPRSQRLLARETLEGSINLGAVSLSVLHSIVPEQGQLKLTIWPLDGAEGAPPTDLLFGRAPVTSRLPLLSLPLSLAAPRIGSKVYCVGYTATRVAREGLLIEDLTSGKKDWDEYYRHELKVVEGRVTKLFPLGFATSYGNGACFTVDATIGPGMSGGPVFNESGCVCGVNYASAANLGGGSFVSMLYPALMTQMPFGASSTDGKVKMRFSLPMIELIGRHLIRTDGSEDRLLVNPVEAGNWSIGPLIDRNDSDFVFADGHGFEANRPAQPVAESGYRVKRIRSASASDSGDGK